MFTLMDRATMKVLSIVAYQATTNMRKAMDKIYTESGQKVPALAEVERLKALDMAGLVDAFGGYTWTADKPFDWIPLAYQVVVRKADDCDGSGVLYCTCRPKAATFLICNFDMGKPMKFDKWHYFAWEPGYVCSNFKIEETKKAPIEWARKNATWANALVKVDWTMKNPNALILETHSF